MKKIIQTAFVILLLSSVNNAFAQGWPWASKSNGAGTENFWGVSKDPSGNNYMAGQYSNGTGVFGTFSFPSIGIYSDAVIAKTNSTGVFQWAVRAGSTMADYAQCVVSTSADVFVAGVFRSTATFYSTTAATASLVGATTDDECFIARYDASGVVQWAVKYTGVPGTSQMPRRITVNEITSQIYVAGVTGGKMFVNCYDFSGTLIWSTVSSNTGSATGWGIVSDGSASGNTYAAAQYNGTVTLGGITSTGTNGTLLVKFDNVGTPTWVTNIGGATTGDEVPRGGLGIDALGNLYVGGDYSSPANISGIAMPAAASRNFFIAKYNSAGAVQWAQGAGGAGLENVLGMATDAAGYSYISVNSFSNNSISIDCQTFPSVLGNTDNKFYVVSYDNTGAVMWAGAPTSDNDQTSAWGLCAGGSGSAIVTGTTIQNTSFGSTVFSSPNGDAFVAKIGSSIPVISPVTICAGNTATLTPASPVGTGYTFNWWSASTGGTLLFTGPSYTTPALSSTTTYYVSVSPGGCLSTRVPVTVTVNPIPVVTITGTANICTGGSSTLVASGAASYVWLPGFIPGSTLTVSPSATTVYTAIGTTAGCSSSATFTVTVGTTPTVTASASPSTLTPPTVTTSFLTSTVTGGSGFTYSWSPATGLNSTTVSNPVATPTVTTTYALTVTNSSGCSATTTVTVVVNPGSLCTLPLDYDIASGSDAISVFGITTGTANKNIRITGMFTVNENFMFTACNIVMMPGSSIEVTSGNTLYIVGGTHLFGCTGMWNGINLQSGSNAQIKNASIIEDAVVGVKVNQGTTAQIDLSIFNRNYTAVELTSNTSAVSPLTFTGNVVTCRDIPFSSVILSNPSAATVWSNIVSGTFASVNMESPFYSYKSIYGILATDVNYLNAGSDVSVNNVNGFDNLSSTGIYLTRTNAVVYNNNFRSITSASNCFTCTPLLGIGICANGSTTVNYSLKVGGTSVNQPNTFTDVNSSVEATNYQTNFVQNNTIANASSTTAIYGGYGKSGIKISPTANNTINVLQNNLTNCATGIWVNRINATSISSVALTVDNNSITATLPGFCNNGIYVTDYVGTTTVTPVPSEINNNTIIEAVNCINLSNTKTKNDVIFNSCKVRYAATGNQNGIKLVGCQFQNLQRNHTKFNVGTAAASGGNILAYGIYLQNSPNNYLGCNLMEDAARSLVFDGNCSSPNGITQNTFRRAQDGFVLLNAATVIGNQGSSVLPSNNYWDLTFSMPTQIRSMSSTGVTLYGNNISSGAAVTNPPTIIGTVMVTTTVATVTACGAAAARGSAPKENETTTSINTSYEPMLIYPNPNNGTFSLETNSTDEKNVFVYDMLGNIVFAQQKTTTQLLTVDVSHLANGIYFVKVQIGNKIQTQKIIKE